MPQDSPDGAQLGNPGIWYVAYGSNMLPSRLRRYLPSRSEPLRTRPVRLRNIVYFAGQSRVWGQSVAFLTPTADEHAPPRTLAVAYRVTESELHDVAVGENAVDFAFDGFLPSLVEVASAVELPVIVDASPYRGKYNLLLRLDDIEGSPAYTVTTSRALKRGRPAAGYLDVIARGLATAPNTRWSTTEASTYVGELSASGKV